MQNLTIDIIQDYPQELEELRKICFPGPQNNNEDPFNALSNFLIIRNNGIIAASSLWEHSETTLIPLIWDVL